MPEGFAKYLNEDSHDIDFDDMVNESRGKNEAPDTISRLFGFIELTLIGMTPDGYLEYAGSFESANVKAAIDLSFKSSDEQESELAKAKKSILLGTTKRFSDVLVKFRNQDIFKRGNRFTKPSRQSPVDHPRHSTKHGTRAGQSFHI